MEFCQAGQHPAIYAYAYNGTWWCPEHRPPPVEPDPATKGLCEVGRTHQSDATFWINVMGKRACRKHLAVLVREVIRRSEYGQS